MLLESLIAPKPKSGVAKQSPNVDRNATPKTKTPRRKAGCIAGKCRVSKEQLGRRDLRCRSSSRGSKPAARMC